ncbi:uncharacterized protein LOC6534092 [Drosophila yakuba]|uniref:Kazal-like domain-containing protein n=1 Tax=Drosophila yakuba TaxID=7245 RepID=B4PI15_DROYA|nr:uncharacterized protein LOC6534092 [Drosophila yakuba]EDW94490.1 uncharacterized protein Dyak_GE22011 [Drosophila yakuba]
MKTILVLAILALAQATEVSQTAETATAATASGATTGKPQQTELPIQIQNLITSHINHVLQHIKNKPQDSNTLSGPVDWHGSGSGSGSGAPVVKPHPDLLPPVAHSGDVLAPALADVPAAAPALQPGLQSLQAGNPPVKVTQHQATGTLIHHGRPVVHNKVVMPPVEQVVHSLPGQEPINVAEKLQKLHQHVTKVMQQAEIHIPLAVNQAIKQKKELEAQREKEQLQKDKEIHKGDDKNKEVQGNQEDPEPQPNAAKAGRSLVIPDKVSSIVNQVHAHIPQLIAQHREEMKLGKCNFQCPKASLSICASNGKCVVNFPGQCELSQWNCFNTKNVFHQVHDAECQNTITCYKRDMM